MWLCLNIFISSFDRIMYSSKEAELHSKVLQLSSNIHTSLRPLAHEQNSSGLWDRNKHARVGLHRPELCLPAETFLSVLPRGNVTLFLHVSDQLEGSSPAVWEA